MHQRPVHAALRRLADERIEADWSDRVRPVRHEIKPQRKRITNTPNHFCYIVERYIVKQCPPMGSPNCFPIGERVSVRHAKFDPVDSERVELSQYSFGRLQIRIPGVDEYDSWE